MKIFISYTLRDNMLNKAMLEKFNQVVQCTSQHILYIDILHNSNIDDPQGYVIKNLRSSDAVWVIETKKVYSSEWVQKELSIAKENKIPIHPIKFEMFLRMITQA